MSTILLDVGGSYIKCADGRKIPIPSRGTREAISAALREACTAGNPVGIAIPGPFDYRNGIFLMKHKYAAVYGQKFADLVLPSEGTAAEGTSPSVAEKKADAPSGVSPSAATQFRFMHDVNAPLAGAVKMMGLKDVALVTLGTGLGFSYALEGVVQENTAGSPAMSLWDQPWKDGILEDVCSARGISSAYTRLSGTPCNSAFDVAKKAGAGDLIAREVYAHVGETLGEALRPILETLGIRILLMGGQISKSLDLMLQPLQQALANVDVLPLPEGAVFEGLATLFETN